MLRRLSKPASWSKERPSRDVVQVGRNANDPPAISGGGSRAYTDFAPPRQRFLWGARGPTGASPSNSEDRLDPLAPDEVEKRAAPGRSAAWRRARVATRSRGSD